MPAEQDDPHRQIVKEFLERRDVGYTVKVIQEGDVRTADLFAYADDDKLLVEVKSRVEDLDEASTLRDSPPGTVVSRDTLIERDTPISRIVEDAVDQLKKSMRQYDGLPIHWFAPDPVLGIADADRLMEATLFGIRPVYWHSGDESGYSLCYLADRTDFHKYRDTLAAAIIHVHDRGGKLLINPYAPARAEIRRSRLYKFFSRGGGVVDLEFIKSSTAGFILFGDFDRSDETLVLRKLHDLHPEIVCRFEPLHALGGYTSFSV